jgi:hypothetical protein
MAIDRIDVKPERSGALMRIWEDGSGAPTTYTLVCRGGEWMVDEVETKAGSVEPHDPAKPLPGWRRQAMLTALRSALPDSPCNGE